MPVRRRTDSHLTTNSPRTNLPARGVEHQPSADLRTKLAVPTDLHWSKCRVMEQNTISRDAYIIIMTIVAYGYVWGTALQIHHIIILSTILTDTLLVLNTISFLLHVLFHFFYSYFFVD